MPWSAGSFTRTDGTRTGSTTWQQAQAAAVNILSSSHDVHDQDLASGIDACLTKDGSNTPTANLPMGGFKHTGAVAASASGEYVEHAQWLARTASETQTGIVELATDAETQTGTDTARAITPANLSARTATATRTGVVELATDAETITGTDTARAITPANLTARTATETRTGIVELATVAEASAGTDTERAITAAGLKAYADAAVAALIPSGTAMLFVQAAAPTGWTKSVTHDDKALRVVSGTGGGSGGAKDFSWLFSTSISNIAAHTHTGTTSTDGVHNHTDTGTHVGGGSTPAATWYANSNPQSYTGNAGSHQHTFTTASTGAGVSTSLDVKYVDAIICTKD